MTEQTHLEPGQQLATFRPVESGTEVAPIIPNDFASVYRFAELVAESGMAPTGIKSPQAIAVAIMHGYELGLTPMAALQSIAVINGRPSVWGDGALAIVRASGLLEDFEETYEGTWGEDDFTAICIVKRKGQKKEIRGDFSIGEAKTAGLWEKAGPWKQYARRMLKMRARAFALRDAFTDIMRGMAFAEEVQDYHIVDAEVVSDEPPAPSGEKKPRGRPAKNKYQEEEQPKKSGDEPEEKEPEKAETVEEKGGAQTDDEPPAPKETSKKAAADDEPPAPSGKKDEPPAPKGDHEEGDMLADLYKAIGPDREFKQYVAKTHATLCLAKTMDELKAAWNGRERPRLVPAQEEHMKTLRDLHKDRIANNDKPKDDEPPAPDGGASFDLAGFLHELDVKLGEAKDPDTVNSIFEQMTAQPIALGLLSDDDMDNDVRPIMEEHMGRVDFN